ncbi:MAG TPA: bacteriohopanetetrol glucosamine biosynthesis glycosyltransferase HpnI [Candidatus Acidoferrales bacterium]|nr:bacteriohopanetetrol glucosamine biosynthesis glycosyltransferase HpnI [Candidatus Acidoferrales bacterium]
MTPWTAVRDTILMVAFAPYVYYILASVAAAKFFRRPLKTAAHASSNGEDFTPPVSILKPIRGLDRETYENFASFCAQDYPEFEILFCVSDNSDPAVPVIEKIIAAFPQRPIRLLIGSEPIGASDKVNKLCRMAREAHYDLLLVSDSDVRVEQGFLRSIAAPFIDAKVGGVTCLYRGLTDGSFAADIEALGNTADFAPGVLTAWLFNGQKLDFMLGAVMAATKRHLAAIGGFESFADYFCDDYELGNRLAARGFRVELSTAPVSIVYPHQNLAAAFRHQLRWNLSIRFSRPWGHAGLIFSQGLFWTVLGTCLAPGWYAYIYPTAYALFRTDAALSVGARGIGDQLIRRKGWLLVIRDAFAFFVWVASFFPRRIHWRDRQFIVRDKKLLPVR